MRYVQCEYAECMYAVAKSVHSWYVFTTQIVEMCASASSVTADLAFTKLCSTWYVQTHIHTHTHTQTHTHTHTHTHTGVIGD